jgi:hypothetical protein
MAVFKPCFRTDSNDFWNIFFRPYYNCSFSNNFQFTPAGISNQYQQPTDGIRGCAGMRKLMCFDGKQCNQGNSFREYRRETLGSSGARQDRKWCRYDPHITHAQALKNKNCVFAKKIFAELQMMVLPASVIPDATLRRVIISYVTDTV